jgi:SH3 domain-containing YSC84-like protein 1
MVSPKRSRNPLETGTRRNIMKKPITYVMSMLLVVPPILYSSAFAADKEKDQDRLQNSGTVLKEILDVPDDIPQDLLDKADCVVVFPSVLKAAFIVGGSYGRGAMSCRRGEDFRGSWGAPTMMALEGGSFETDATLRADILSYSRARGAFAGIALEGSTIRPDNGANKQIYGREVAARQIVLSGNVAAPVSAQRLISTLDSRTPKHKS